MTSEASGIVLKSVSIERPGTAKYLIKHGITRIGLLNPASGDFPALFEFHDPDIKTIHTLITIECDEDNGLLPEGSYDNARDAIECMLFEDSPWNGYGHGLKLET